MSVAKEYKDNPRGRVRKSVEVENGVRQIRVPKGTPGQASAELVNMYLPGGRCGFKGSRIAGDAGPGHYLIEIPAHEAEAYEKKIHERSASSLGSSRTSRPDGNKGTETDVVESTDISVPLVAPDVEGDDES